jgi:tRNA threonylcarbamoyladenosine modification (KEOPS) complex  Pcc1 subunit
MSEITLEGIAAVIHEELTMELNPIKERLGNVEQTLAQHTTVLDSIAKDLKTLKDEKTIAASRLDRLEHWAQQVGRKLGIELEV